MREASCDDDELAYSIQQQLLGDCDYLKILEEKFGLTKIEGELQILRQWPGKPNLKRGKFNKYWHEHLAHFIHLLFPGTFVHPWLMDECWGLEYVIHNRLDIQNLIGSKSSGKSAFMARISLALVAIQPTKTCFYAAAPFKNAAGYTIWGEIRSCFKAMTEAHPWMFPNAAYKTSEQRCDFDTTVFYKSAGFVELVGIENVGKLQGIKAEDPDGGGFLGILADEIGVFPHSDFMGILDNASANDNFLCVTGCNFKSIEKMEGRLCKPTGREYASLSLENDHYWESDYSSFTIRLDGHYQPNILSKRVLWIKLLQERKRLGMERTHGLKGPKYMEQIRSFPNNSMADFFVITRDKIQAHGGFDPVMPDGPATRVAFCDPGFGGDPCKIGIFEYGPARVTDLEGTFRTVQMFRPVAAIETIQLDMELKVDATWISRLRNVAVKPEDVLANITENVTLEHQIALRCGELLSQYGVSRENFGYDGSMRASIVHAMVVMLGPRVHSVDFGGAASDRTNIIMQGKTGKEAYLNAVSEMYFNFAGIIESGAFRGGDMVPAAISQLCRRRWQDREKKKQVQPKSNPKKGASMTGYKEENQGRSPDDSDCLVGAAEIALRKGFSPPLLQRATKSGGLRPFNLSGISGAAATGTLAARGSKRLNR